KDEPGSSLAHFNLATIYAREKRFRPSADEYREALRLDSGNDVARVSLVKTLVGLAEFDEALPLIQDYAQRKPDDFEAHYVLGTVERGLGRYEPAERELKRAMQMDPNHYDVRYNLGFVLAKLGKPQEALPHLQKALELHPGSAEARFQLAGVLRALNQPERSHQEFQNRIGKAAGRAGKCRGGQSHGSQPAARKRGRGRGRSGLSGGVETRSK
ncbi:MAG: hypothetical protein DMG58_07290, partial [Acidobacteria bacterium]